MKPTTSKSFWQFDANYWFQKLNSSDKGLSETTADEILKQSGISRKGKSALEKNFLLCLKSTGCAMEYRRKLFLLI